ncbi:MAG: glycosyl hydrolase [Bacteroidetes bacterium]|nr:glycosyl hydrolase [Bacteroidota bacterium]
MMKKIFLFLLVICLSISISASEEKDEKNKEKMSSETFSGLKFREIGPALTSGRISDFAVNPNNYNEYYVAVASGGVWKTTNRGVTFTPIFDSQASYSIGCITIDPNNEFVVWVGSGENNSQRSVAWGDGVYKSEDGGKNWKNMGLKKSEHIGKILIDPRNSNVVYVASQGPLWGPGGDRGLYKSTDSGENWEKVLEISENTGVTDIAFDPRNPDEIYAASYQRRRHVFTLINGGPESAIYKSVDAGKNWNKLKTGLPSEDVGRIGLAVSPANPDLVYAIIEAEDEKGGFFISTNRGAAWDKQNKYIPSSPQYYTEIIADPKNEHRVYSMDTYTVVTEDRGKNWNRLSLKNRHVDDHALWINPNNTDHLLLGGDGGIYESFDRGDNWDYKANFPVTQFYRVSVDNSLPFYFVYGGTQDNNSLGGPSRTLKSDGIHNSDWFVTNGGDGFESAIDPLNPDIVYAQSQYGWIVRYDKKSGEAISIKPQEREGEDAYRWNWDSPLIISPHLNTRLYFAANKLFKSEDRGNTWEVISGDLSRQIDRNKLKVMGKVWSADAVSKNASTSIYGNIVSLAESPLKEGLIYVGTDDGLIQVTEDGGKNWRKIDKVPVVPETTYVSCLLADKFDSNTVYAAFDNHKDADFKPYILKSTNRGKNWKSISGNIPENFTVYSLVQDHVKPELLFAGTEFGVFFSPNSGEKWIQLKGGIPTISIRDIDIQQRENDLVLASFGRGFFILDDYSALRSVSEESLNLDGNLFEVKDALMYMEIGGRYGQGDNFYKTPNPPVGATFTYYLKEAPKSKKDLRKEKEKELEKENKDIPYPSFEDLRTEDNERGAYLLFNIKDESGQTVRKLLSAAKKGINRITWDLRYASSDPIKSVDEKNKLSTGKGSTLALPGKYSVSMSLYDGENIKPLSGEVEFNAVTLNNTTLPAGDRKELVEFQSKLRELSRQISASVTTAKELLSNLDVMKQAIYRTANMLNDDLITVDKIEITAKDILVKLEGDESISKRDAPQPPSISERIDQAISTQWKSTSSPTSAQRENYRIAEKEFKPVNEKLEKLIRELVLPLQEKLNAAKSPWIPSVK